MIERNIKETVLLGTNRKNLELDYLPLSIKTEIDSTKSESEQLIDALSFLSYYLDNGKLPHKLDEVQDLKIIKEDKNYSPYEITLLLKEILVQDIISPERLLVSWVRMVESRDEIMDPTLILALKEKLNLSSESVLKSFLQVIGKKGRAFAVSELYHLDLIGDQDIWNSGGMKKRLSFFERLRITDLEQANNLLHLTWKTENANDKLAFLMVISNQLNPKDEEFLSTIFKLDYRQVTSMKPVFNKCKTLLISMLARLENVDIHSELQLVFAPYIKEVDKSGIFGKLLGKKDQVLILPENQDEIWSGSYMNDHFGFPASNKNISYFDHDALFWMSYFIDYLPIKFWTNLLNKDTEGVYRFFLFDKQFRTTISGKNIPIFKNAILNNLLLIKNSDAISIVVKLLDANDLLFLMPIMSQDTYEDYLLKNEQLIITENLSIRTNSINSKWSVNFSKKVISFLLKKMSNGHFVPRAKDGIVISNFYHERAIDFLKKISETGEYIAKDANWIKYIEEPICKTIEIKEKIKEYQKSTKL